MEELTIEAAHDLLMADLEPEMPEAPVAAPEAPEASGESGVPDAPEAPDAAATAEGQADLEPTAIDDGSVGLGIDIVEIARMQAILDRTPAFAERVFSPTERTYCDAKANPATHYALRFAAKEAVVKALGTGFAQGIGVRDIEVRNARGGKPQALLSGRAREIAQEQGIRELSLSLSYTHTDAVACALAITQAATRASEKRKDPMEELARQFKETRGILDEL